MPYTANSLRAGIKIKKGANNMACPIEFAIIFWDLTHEAKERLLKASKVETPEELNWGMATPIAYVCLGEEDIQYIT